jgi:hypothetical protein
MSCFDIHHAKRQAPVLSVILSLSTSKLPRVGEFSSGFLSNVIFFVFDREYARTLVDDCPLWIVGVEVIPPPARFPLPLSIDPLSVACQRIPEEVVQLAVASLVEAKP